MNLKSVFIISAVLLFVSAPAWGDSMKFSQKGSPAVMHFTDDSSKSGHSDILFLNGSNKDKGHHYGFFNSNQNRFHLDVEGQQSDEPVQDPTSTPEPTSLSLLIVGLLSVGALATRRNLSTVAAQ